MAKIRVMPVDLRCFDVDSVTLEPLCTCCYDPWAVKQCAEDC
jgi:hypothetical protein